MADSGFGCNSTQHWHSDILYTVQQENVIKAANRILAHISIHYLQSRSYLVPTSMILDFFRISFHLCSRTWRNCYQFFVSPFPFLFLICFFVFSVIHVVVKAKISDDYTFFHILMSLVFWIWLGTDRGLFLSCLSLPFNRSCAGCWYRWFFLLSIHSLLTDLMKHKSRHLSSFLLSFSQALIVLFFKLIFFFSFIHLTSLPNLTRHPSRYLSHFPSCLPPKWLHGWTERYR